jgi:hypothetical protein
MICVLAGCTSGTGGASSTASGPVPRNIRALRIVPRTATACPSDVISASYEVVGDSGTRVTLGQRDLSLLKRSGIAAGAREDGAWQTAADPVASLYDGFHLTAVLASDTTVRADTVVVPTYQCLATATTITTEANTLPKAGYVRLGTLRTPFYDSVVVASIEIEDRPPRAVVLGPSEMRSGAITISAVGRDGAQGRGGAQGSDGGPCENGSRGNSGDAGYPGAPGGQMDIILEAGAPWLADLVSIDNRGGRGGAGGPGGYGGRAGAALGTGGRPCSPRQGSPGSPGLKGPDGSPGPLPKTTTIPRSLLWYGSPLWNDITARRVLGQLVEYTTRP